MRQQHSKHLCFIFSGLYSSEPVFLSLSSQQFFFDKNIKETLLPLILSVFDVQSVTAGAGAAAAVVD